MCAICVLINIKNEESDKNWVEVFCKPSYKQGRNLVGIRYKYDMNPDRIRFGVEYYPETKIGYGAVRAE